jgi:hypothetical protein
MTSKRDLKKLVRARQARTGERYTTALQHVVDQRPAIPVLELVDLTAEGQALGFRGRIGMLSDLAERVEGRSVLERLRAILRETADDPATGQLRAVLFQGQPPSPPSENALQLFQEGRRFLARAREGLGGVSAGGKMIAFTAGGEMVVALLWGPLPVPGAPDRALLLLRSPGTFLDESSDGAVMLLRAGWKAP